MVLLPFTHAHRITTMLKKKPNDQLVEVSLNQGCVQANRLVYPTQLLYFL